MKDFSSLNMLSAIIIPPLMLLRHFSCYWLAFLWKPADKILLVAHFFYKLKLILVMLVPCSSFCYAILFWNTNSQLVSLLCWYPLLRLTPFWIIYVFKNLWGLISNASVVYRTYQIKATNAGLPDSSFCHCK